MVQQIFKCVLITSLAGTGLTMLLTLIRPVTRKIFPGIWHYYMWLFVLISMVLPVRITLPKEPPLILNAASTAVEQQSDVNELLTEAVEQKTEEPEIKPEQNPYINSLTGSKTDTIAFVWLYVMIFLFAFKLINYMIFLFKLEKHSDIITCPELKRYTNRKIIARVSGKITSPFMIGLFKPTLFLPKANLTDKQLDNVLAHEMTHFKRNDILCKWFANIVKCIHWFNPAIYFISRQMNLECEISCDLTVVGKMTREQENEYINTILALLSSADSKSVPFTTGMAENKKALEKRFIMIKNRFNASKRTMIISIVSAVLILTVTVLASGFINGKALNRYENTSLALIDSKEKHQDVLNFLVFGVDEQNRADTIMLLSFNNNNIFGLSIPRDTVFESDGEKISKILSEENGVQKAVDIIGGSLSVPITYYAKVNLSAVKDIVDIAGGIEIDVPMDMVYDDPYKDLHIELKKGRQALDGRQAVNLLRFRRSNDGRGYTNQDLSRIEIGQQFIREFINQKLNKDFIDKMPEILKILSDNITTDYPLENLVNDIDSFNINETIITFNTLPGNITTTDRGFVIYKPDFEEEIAAAGDSPSHGGDNNTETDVNISRKLQTMGLSVEFTPNTNWIRDISYTEINQNYTEIRYFDNILGAGCKMLISKDTPLSLDYKFSGSSDQIWQAVEKQVDIRLRQSAENKVAAADWTYNNYYFAIIGENVNFDNSSVTSIPKTAIYIINHL